MLTSALLFCVGLLTAEEVTKGALEWFENAQEYRIDGTQQKTENDVLYGIEDLTETVTSEASHGLTTSWESSLQRKQIGLLSKQEWITVDAGQLLVTKDIRTEAPVNYESLPPFPDSAPITVRYHEEMVAFPIWSPILIGVQRADEPSIKELLRTGNWRVSHTDGALVTIATENTDTGTYSLSIDTLSGYRPVQLERVCRAGQRYRGEILPSSNRKEVKLVYTCNWKDDSLKSCEFTLSVLEPSGKRGSRSLALDVASFDLRRSGIIQPNLQTPISNETPVYLVDGPQVQAVWRDGDIVKLYDSGSAERLATVEFERTKRTWPWILLGLSIAAVVAVVIRYTLGKGGAQ